jgi:hypothetical protein
MWKPWNGLQVYSPDAWKDSVEDPTIFDVPPPQCKKGGAKIRITCDDDGTYHPKKHEGKETLENLMTQWKADFEGLANGEKKSIVV